MPPPSKNHRPLSSKELQEVVNRINEGISDSDDEDEENAEGFMSTSGE